jgi:nitrite reductase/ring-hydroxylating ferredoxin subunit
MIKTLEGKPTDCVLAGYDYLVPAVRGIPVVVPSHVDEGNDGKTSRHWHVDTRWGNSSKPKHYWNNETIEKFQVHDDLWTLILRDDGQSIEYERFTAEKSFIWPTGSAWSSLVWLYYHLGDLPANNGYCVHHHTRLDKWEDELVCPSHGMRFKADGSPRFQGPFFVQLTYGDAVSKVPVTFDHELEIPFSVKVETRARLQLIDSNQEIVVESCDYILLPPDGESYLIEIIAWPSDINCPAFAEEYSRP